jgi:cytochrome c-type biogenesis protein
MVVFENISLLVFALTAGGFTFFAPCAYPLLPGYITYYLGESTTHQYSDSGFNQDRGRITNSLAKALGVILSPVLAVRLSRAIIVSIIVSAGFFVIYGVLAGVVAFLGAPLLTNISALELVVGVLLVMSGGLMAAGWEPPALRVPLPKRRRSKVGYFAFGVLYGAAAAGCTAPIFIGIAFQALSLGTGFSLLVFGAYAAGMSMLMMTVTIATALGQGVLLEWFSQHVSLVYRGAGVLLMLAGVAEIYLFLFRFNGLELLGLGTFNTVV